MRAILTSSESPTATDTAFLHILESSRPGPKEAKELIESLWRKTVPF